ncbi:MAG: hypothetical protein DRO99_03670 [Candidatus Aenigmatarchaeota archaeon]|nr:MAG: hypothetical protein DRO99_03670 [Candidatus Aenigmarchaeota archaeon]
MEYIIQLIIISFVSAISSLVIIIVPGHVRHKGEGEGRAAIPSSRVLCRLLSAPDRRTRPHRRGFFMTDMGFLVVYLLFASSFVLGQLRYWGKK